MSFGLFAYVVVEFRARFIIPSAGLEYNRSASKGLKLAASNVDTLPHLRPVLITSYSISTQSSLKPLWLLGSPGAQ